MSGIQKLVREIHRRSLWQVLGIFLAGSWGVLQVVEVLTETAGLPDWTPTFALVLLLIGLPVVMATAFVQEGMPGQDGEVGDVQAPNAVEGGDGPASDSAPGGAGSASGVPEPANLADFRDATDGNLGDVVTEALRVDLQESPVLELLPPTYVQDAMGRMGRAEDAPFTAEVARELAVRDGFKAVVQGEVAGVGSGYLLTDREAGQPCRVACGGTPASLAPGRGGPVDPGPRHRRAARGGEPLGRGPGLRPQRHRRLRPGPGPLGGVGGAPGPGLAHGSERAGLRPLLPGSGVPGARRLLRPGLPGRRGGLGGPCACGVAPGLSQRPAPPESGVRPVPRRRRRSGARRRHLRRVHRGRAPRGPGPGLPAHRPARPGPL